MQPLKYDWLHQSWNEKNQPRIYSRTTEHSLLLLLQFVSCCCYFFSRLPFYFFDMCCDATRDKFISSIFFLFQLRIWHHEGLFCAHINAISKCIRVHIGLLCFACEFRRLFYHFYGHCLLPIYFSRCEKLSPIFYTQLLLRHFCRGIYFLLVI